MDVLPLTSTFLPNLPSLLFSPRNTDVNFFPLFPLPLEPCSKSQTFTSIISILLLLSSPQGSRKVSSASICRSRHNIWIRITILGCLPCLPTSPWVLSSNSEGTRILVWPHYDLVPNVVHLVLGVYPKTIVIFIMRIANTSINHFIGLQ